MSDATDHMILRPDPADAAVPVDTHPGAALEAPAGTNPMLSGLGPGAWADRAHRLDVTVDGDAKIRPLRDLPDYRLHPRDPNPIGYSVVGLDGVEAGIVRDAWVDISELVMRYLEMDVHATGRRALVPVPFTKIHRGTATVRVRSIAAVHFADVPATEHPDLISLLEEDRISAYYAAGYLYATPDRMGPVL